MKNGRFRYWVLCVLAAVAFCPAAAHAQSGITLEALKTKCDRLRRQIDADTGAAYSNALMTAGLQLKQQGDVDGYLLLQAEQKCFAKSQALPEGEARETLIAKIPLLVDVIKKLEADRNGKLANLLKQYIAQLELQVPALLQEDKIDQAKQAKSLLEKAKGELAIATGATGGTGATASTGTGEAEPPPVKPDSAEPTGGKKPPSAFGSKKAIPEDAAEYNGHHYRVYTDAGDWDRASFLCRTRDGHLVAISDNKENEFVYELMKENDKAWIGASRDMNIWRWSTAVRFEYQNWVSGSQKDSKKAALRAYMLGGIRPRGMGEYYSWADARWGKWDAAPSSEKNSEGIAAYVCEWDY